MSSRARAALLALLVLLVTAGPAAAVMPAATVSGDEATALATDPAPAQTAQEPAGPAETTFVVELESDGDARWTVVMNYSLTTDDRRAAFESLAADFEDGRTLETVTAVQRASDEASTATGREMQITNQQRDSQITNDTGQLIVAFTWTNFARQGNGTLHVDDVFNTSQGWFQGLGPNQALVVEPPEDYTLDSAEPAGYQVSQGSLRWEGERRFEPGELAIEYRNVATSAWPLTVGQSAVAAAMVLGALGAVAYVLRGRSLDVPTPATGESADGGSQPGTNPNGERVAAAGDGPGEDDPVDEELLSDEERIERLLEANGGRMKQANIVSETGWSNAKVSQLLSSMDEEGRIDKLRIGRENLISFPDEDIADTDDEE